MLLNKLCKDCTYCVLRVLNIIAPRKEYKLESFGLMFSQDAIRCMYVCVCVCVCMCVCRYICMYVCMYVCMYISFDSSKITNDTIYMYIVY